MYPIYAVGFRFMMSFMNRKDQQKGSIWSDQVDGKKRHLYDMRGQNSGSLYRGQEQLVILPFSATQMVDLQKHQWKTVSLKPTSKKYIFSTGQENSIDKNLTKIIGFYWSQFEVSSSFDVSHRKNNRVVLQQAQSVATVPTKYLTWKFRTRNRQLLAMRS